MDLSWKTSQLNMDDPDSYYARMLARLRKEYADSDVPDIVLQEAARMSAAGDNMIYMKPEFNKSGEYKLGGYTNPNDLKSLVPLLNDRYKNATAYKEQKAQEAANKAAISNDVGMGVDNLKRMIADREAVRQDAYRNYQIDDYRNYEKAGQEKFGDFDMGADYGRPRLFKPSFLSKMLGLQQIPDNPTEPQRQYQADYQKPTMPQFMEASGYQDDELAQYMQGLQNLMRFK